MGNISSCFYAQSHAAKLIDLQHNTLSLVHVPITAAELMLEHPGYVVSPLIDFRCGFRLSAMKADEIVSGGTVYILIPVTRVHGKLSESEMAIIESASGERRSKRRSSRVLPVVTEISGEGADNPVKVFGEVRDIGVPIDRNRMRQWKPALEPIYEGI
ncbi:uncharacterized protein LOC105173762 [Sesamum indicum]|uniref:Uncharacterized protein LOC105173762 n=1 Tax=Sesamum indicum TaxID=4182 RepID=A0A6I9UI74_SESIN|nr:uncharacterized protein LOC105173762 [Sesamum indicum]